MSTITPPIVPIDRYCLPYLTRGTVTAQAQPEPVLPVLPVTKEKFDPAFVTAMKFIARSANTRKIKIGDIVYTFDRDGDLQVSESSTDALVIDDEGYSAKTPRSTFRDPDEYSDDEEDSDDEDSDDEDDEDEEEIDEEEEWEVYFKILMPYFARNLSVTKIGLGEKMCEVEYSKERNYLAREDYDQQEGIPFLSSCDSPIYYYKPLTLNKKWVKKWLDFYTKDYPSSVVKRQFKKFKQTLETGLIGYDHDLFVTNPSGYNVDGRGCDYIYLEHHLPWVNLQHLKPGFTLPDLITAFLNLKSHKFENNYELYTGCSLTDHQLALEFDHGS